MLVKKTAGYQNSRLNHWVFWCSKPLSCVW